MNRTFTLRTEVELLLVALFAWLFIISVAQGQAVGVASYATVGNPTTAVATLDGKYVFVSVTNVGAPNFSGPDSVAQARHDVVSGLQIFREVNGALQHIDLCHLARRAPTGWRFFPMARQS